MSAVEGLRAFLLKDLGSHSAGCLTNLLARHMETFAITTNHITVY